MNARPSRARLQSLCGTARGIASKENHSRGSLARRKPCRYAAIWACKASIDSSRRMAGRCQHRKRCEA
jgi:hypothetical protein